MNFVIKLKPVSYNYLAEGQSGIQYTGLIAQDVESSLTELGLKFSGLDKPKNEDDFYSLRYAEFTGPLIKAIQEQQKLIEDLQQQINELKSK